MASDKSDLLELLEVNSLIETRTIDTHRRRLRAKLGPAAITLIQCEGSGAAAAKREHG